MFRKKLYGKELIEKELRACYNFFIKEVNDDKNSLGYGLIRDKDKFSPNIVSIASVGYGFAALIIGVERNWIDYEKAYYKAEKTLDTFIHNVDGKKGFFYHFVNINTGAREWNCEISIIDTAIFICGALLAGEFFNGKVKEKAEFLYKKINWNWYKNKETNEFYMGYTPVRGFWGKWDMYAEQLMLYVLGAGSPTFPISKDMYTHIKKPVYKDETIGDIIYTYCGTLFTYQFSHAWIDFRNKTDEEGIDWFENSVRATKANRKYCIEHRDRFKTYGENVWGLTACVGPKGYSGGFGALPSKSNLDVENDGTVAPCGIVGSLPFTPELSISAMEFLYNNYHELWGRYGFKDGFNLESGKVWASEEYIGIDKGVSMVMIENYLTGLIWENFMKCSFVNKGMEVLGIGDFQKNLVQK